MHEEHHPDRKIRSHDETEQRQNVCGVRARDDACHQRENAERCQRHDEADELQHDCLNGVYEVANFRSALLVLIGNEQCSDAEQDAENHHGNDRGVARARQIQKYVLRQQAHEHLGEAHRCERFLICAELGKPGQFPLAGRKTFCRQSEDIRHRDSDDCGDHCRTDQYCNDESAGFAEHLHVAHVQDRRDHHDEHERHDHHAQQTDIAVADDVGPLERLLEHRRVVKKLQKETECESREHAGQYSV